MAFDRRAYMRAYSKRYHAEHREELNAAARARYQAKKPEYRAREAAYRQKRHEAGLCRRCGKPAGLRPHSKTKTWAHCLPCYEKYDLARRPEPTEEDLLYVDD